MKKTKILATITSAVLVAAVFAAMPLSASAATTYTPVAGGTTNFDKYLVMNEGANVPNVSFEYTVTSGTAQNFDASGKTIQVYAGPTPEKITFSGKDISDTTPTDSKFEVAFKQTDAAILEANVGSTDYVKNLDAGEKYAKKTAALDFSGVNFDEPGIYRYIITETQGTDQSIVYDADATRVLDVYVVDNAGNLEVSSYVLHATDSTVSIDSTTYGSDGKVVTGDDSDHKSQGFTNEYTSYDLTFSKTVSGNQASKDKYFAFTVNIENAVAGTVYDVSYADDSNDSTTDGNADAAINANPNNATTVITTDVNQPATITVPAGKTSVSQIFYLQHGQKIAVRGLAKGTKYTVSENPEDYIASATAADGVDKNTDDATTAGTEITLDANAMTDTFVKGNAVVDFTNTREGTIPTGVILAVAAPVAVGVILLAAIIVVAIKNKRRDSEEE